MAKTARIITSLAVVAILLAGCVEKQNSPAGQPLPQLFLSSYTGTGLGGQQDGTLAEATFTMPLGITSLPDGRLLVLDTYNNLVRLISNNRVETLAGDIITLDDNRLPAGYHKDGLAADALFNRPASAVVNSKGHIFIADSKNNAVRIIRDGRVMTLTGANPGHLDGAISTAEFNRPMAIAVDEQDNLYLADTLNHCIRKIDPAGTVTTVAGVPGQNGFKNGNADSALFNEPSGIAVSADGSTLYVADTGNHLIRQITGGKVTTAAGTTTAERDGQPLGGYQDGPAEKAMMNYPTGLTLAGKLLVIADTGNHRIRALSPSGQMYTLAGSGVPGDTDGEALQAQMDHPSGLCYVGGILYIADRNNNKIKTLPFSTERFS